MNEVLNFWFKELKSQDWFKKNEKVDQLIIERFSETHTQATNLELFSWRATPQGRLAEIIVLDQFSRNMFRGDARSFAYDSIALALAQAAIEVGDDQKLETIEKSFLYMPFMHSESLVIHDEAVKHFSQPGLESNLEFEHKHRDIIVKFERYPHRNEVLGRQSSSAEMAFLNEPGSSF